MDVGSILILIRHLDRMCWGEFEDENTPFRVAAPVIYHVMAANHFVAARRRDPFIYQ